jgi:hypothetical protein
VRKISVLLLIVFFAGSGLAAVEIGPGLRLFQYDQGSNVNFSQSQNFSYLDVRSGLTGFGSSNFTVEPESSASAELDFYEPFAGRQEFLTNFTARSSPEQNVDFSLSNLPSNDFYEAFFSENDTRIFVGYTDSFSRFNFSTSLSNADISVFNYGEKGVEFSGVSFNSSDPVEGRSLKVETGVLNEGVVDPETFNNSVSVETFNGTEWVEKEFLSSVDTVPENSSTTSNVSWEVKPGPWRFNVSLDPEDEIKETNELNNNGSELIDVDSYQVFYGDSESSKVVGADDRDIYRWRPEQESGLLFFYDVDASFNFEDLEPVNSSDLVELDSALRMRGHNDSIQELWDRDSDGSIDRFESYSIEGRTVSVPVTNSSENSVFDTGILYDSGDGPGFDGSQDIVVVSKILDNRAGGFGTYDYEARVPFYLGELRDGSDRVEVFSQLN